MSALHSAIAKKFPHIAACLVNEPPEVVAAYAKALGVEDEETLKRDNYVAVIAARNPQFAETLKDQPLATVHAFARHMGLDVLRMKSRTELETERLCRIQKRGR